MIGQTAAVLNNECLETWLHSQTHDRLTEVRAWIAATEKSEVPPIYRLTDPDQLKSSGIHHFEKSFLPFAESTRQTDSGILEIVFFDPKQYLDNPTGNLFASLTKIADSEDRRSFSRLDTRPSDVVLGEMRSRVTDTTNLPVIGPGGRISVYREQQRIEADIVVRHRQRPVKSEWRDPEPVVRRLGAQILRERADVKITAQFGYLELSKYERQLWMRPAFIFVLEGSSSAEYRVPWQAVIAEPATVNQDIAINEGMGDWGESVSNE